MTDTLAPDHAAPTTSQADAAEDHGGHAGQRVRTWYRRPEPGARRQAEARDGCEEAGQDIGEELRAADGDAAPESGQRDAP